MPFLIFFDKITMVNDMQEHIDEFINYLTFEKKYSDNTIENYIKDLNLFSDFIKTRHINYQNMDYSRVSSYLIYLNDLKYSSSSINRHLSSIRSFYEFMLNRKVVSSSPFKLVHGPKKEKKLPNYLKYSEFEDLVNTCDETALGFRNRMILELLFATGVRVSEAVNIKLTDIDFKECEIKIIGKGKKMRIVYFNQVCKKVMSEYVLNARNELLKGKKSEYLLLNHLGNKLTRRGVQDILEKLIKKSSIKHKISPHTLRHTFATLLLNEGMDIREVQELLGHERLSTTSIYTHVSNEELRRIYLQNHPRAHKK